LLLIASRARSPAPAAAGTAVPALTKSESKADITRYLIFFYSFCFGTFGSGLARQQPNTAEKRVHAFFRLRMGWQERWVFSPPEFTL